MISVPWLFRLPWFRRFHGYTLWPALILLKRPLREVSDDLIVHELCHVWQMQHHPIAMPLSISGRDTSDNPNEVEARRAAAETRASRPPRQLRLDVRRADLLLELVLRGG